MPMTTQQVQQIFRAVLSGWPTQRQRMTADDVRGMAALYTAGLIDLEYEVADAAIARIVRTEEWMPTVAKIRATCVIVKHGERQAGAEAWGEVVAMMRKHGWNHAPGIDFQFKDAITAKLVRAFGWSELCHAEGGAHIADRARFIEAYDQMVESERTLAAATPGIAQPVLPPPLAIHQLERGRAVLSPEDRKSILDELVAEAKKRNPELDLGVTPTKVCDGNHPVDNDGICMGCGEHEHRAKHLATKPFRCKKCGWEGHPAGKDTCPTCGGFFNRFDCNECGERVTVDDDGCCKSCGRDTQVVHDPGVH